LHNGNISATRTVFMSMTAKGTFIRLTTLCLTILSLASGAGAATRDEVEAQIAALDRRIAAEPARAELLTQRGDLRYLQDDLQRAVEDFSAAIKLDKRQDRAWFGRGMALGRMGRIDESIADLDVYIKRHQRDSVALTKRGVRNIWRNNLADAERDLTRAVKVDPKNAEAHDDLGVVYAKTHRLAEAAEHFATTIQLDPSYQKAYHNLAICYHAIGQFESALKVVDAGLTLAAENRPSLTLKAAILKAMGRTKEAQEIAEQVEFLPQDNWTERSAIDGATTQGVKK
jgi:Flp pilus assembly protein TadD